MEVWSLDKLYFLLAPNVVSRPISVAIRLSLPGIKVFAGFRVQRDPIVRERVSDPINGVFSPNPDWRSLYELVAKYYDKGRMGLGLIAMVGCILHSPVKQSLAFQVSFAQTLAKLFPKRSSLWREIIEPFFLAYWAEKESAGEVVFRTSQSYMSTIC